MARSAHAIAATNSDHESAAAGFGTKSGQTVEYSDADTIRNGKCRFDLSGCKNNLAIAQPYIAKMLPLLETSFFVPGGLGSR